MQKNFTKRFTQLLAAAINWRKPVAVVALLALISTTAVLLRAAILTTIVSLPVSSDTAWNGPSRGFTPLNNVVVREESSGDFRNGTSGQMILTAPAGWVFKGSGVTIKLTNIGVQGQPTQVNIDAGTITYPTSNSAITLPNSTTIRIPYSVDNVNRLDQIEFLGLEVMPIDGNVLTPGNVQFTVNNTNNVVGPLPIDVATLTQTVGAPRKLAFETQPGATTNSLVGDNLLNQPQVRLRDYFNRDLNTGTNSVSLSINSGTAGAVLTSSPTNAVNGLATFAGTRINLAGTYTLTATSTLTGETTTVTSEPFVVSNKRATISSLSTSPSCITTGSNQNFTATITGTNFIPGAIVRLTNLDNSSLPVANFDNTYITSLTSTQIIVNVPGSYVQFAPAGNYSVQVINPAPVQAGTPGSVPFTINPLLSAGNISGVASVCAGSVGVVYSIPVVTGATAYNWSVPTNATITSTVTNALTSSITVNFGTATSGNISVAVVNACNTPGPTSTFPVTVNQFPAAAITAPNGTESCTSVALVADLISGANYDWLLNGVSIGAPNQNTYTATTSGSYSVRVTNNSCPAVSNVIDVVILTPNNIIFNGPIATFCAEDNVTLRARTGDGYGYVWSLGGTTVGNGADLIVTVPGIYSLKLTTSGNCEINATTDVRELPKVTNNIISTSLLIICTNATPPNQITGTIPQGGAGSNTYDYQWQSSTDGIKYDDITGATGQNYTPASALTQTTYFQRVVTSGSCADISTPIQITVNPLIVGNNITTPGQTICTGNQLLLEAPAPSGGSGTYTYRWQSSTNGAAYSFVTPPSTTDLNYTYDPGNFTGTILFRRQVTSGGCISNSDAIEIIVAPLPVANAGADKETCSNVGIQIGTPAVAGLSYTWSPANGLSSTTDAQPTVTITNTGTTAITQTYTLTVRNPSTGCSSVADEVVVTVNPLPQVTFPTTFAPLCVNNAPITLTGGSPAGGTYTGTGVSNGQFDPSVAGDGLHIITYTYTDPTTKCPNTATQIITVNPLPIANAGVSKEICSGVPTTIGSAAVTGLTYNWSGVNGADINNLSSTTAAQPTVTIINTGNTPITQTYSLTVTNTTTTCTSTNNSQVTITVNPLPTVLVNSPVTCAGTPTTITATVSNGTGPYSYNWTVPAGVSKPATNVASFQTTVAGNYSVVVTDAQNCVSASGSGSVTVNALPVANAGGTQDICSGGSTTLGTTAVAGLTYRWSPVTGLSNPNIAQPTVSLTNTGTTATTQIYTLTVTNPTTTCFSTSQATVRVNPLPVANAGANRAICSGGISTALGVAPVAGLTYSWSPATGLSNANIAQPTVSLTNAGTTPTTQIYTLTVTNPTTTCFSTSQVTITVNPLPVVSITNLTAGQNFYTGSSSITLVGSPSGGTFSISGNTGLTGNVFSPCAAGAGQKTITYTYSNANNCINTASVVVNVVPSVYTVMNTANPFPICKGQSTTYTATVYRDIVVYDVTSPNHSLNAEYLAAPSWKQDEFIRYWQPEIAPKPGAAATTTDLIQGLGNEKTIFSYQWYRNTNAIGADDPQRKNAGLSATDEMYVRVKLKDNQTVGCGVTQTSFGTIESNHLKLSAPQEYSFLLSVLPNPACSNQNIVLSATPSLGNIPFTGIEVNFWRKRILAGGAIDSVQLNPTALAQPPYTYEVPAGVIQNGDIVSVAWQTDQIKCFAKGDAGSFVTMIIAQLQTMTVANNGLYCEGGNGVAVGLTNSQTGISYQLQKVNSDNTITNMGTPVAGTTGQSVTFGNQLAGNYRVQLVTPTTNCETFGSITVTETPLPRVFTVTGGGAYCVGVNGVSINLSGGEVGMTYNLLRGSTVVRTVTRTNAAPFSFDNVIDAGIYTVKASTVGNSTTATCPRDMSGNVTVSPTALPTAYNLSVSNGGVYCAGGTGVNITVSNSQAGIRYILRNGTTEVRTVDRTIAGSFTFNNVLAAGTYTVEATTVGNGTTIASCPIAMNNSVDVAVTPLPDAFTVSGGGRYCANEIGQFINLSSSQTGVFYQLYRNDGTNDIYTGVGANGNGAAISFGPQTQAGVYTIRATTVSTPTPPTAQCTVSMAGSATISIDPLPIMQAITGGDSFCNTADAAGSPVSLAGSQSGVIYELLDPSNNVVSSKEGDGTGFTFGTYKAAGTYTVIATAPGNCSRTMGTIIISPITPPVLQTVSGNRNFCRIADPNGVQVSLTGSEANTTYQLMNGNTPVGNPGTVNANGTVTFDTYLTTSTNYSIMATRNTCSTSIPVTGIAEIAPVSNTVTITEPNQVTFGGSATYKAVSSIADENPTYKWYVAILDSNDPTFKLQYDENGILYSGDTFTLTPVPAGYLSVQVEVTAPDNMCLATTNRSVFEDTNPLYPLPVEMLYLKAEKKQNNLVVLEWATAMEKMNEGFQIEVSQDAVNYRTLSFVPTKNGNTTAKQVYTFHDKENGKYGTRYYRIKQMDVDGTSEYFGPKAVQMDALREQIVAYPNPFTSEVNLDVNAEAAGSMHVIVTNAVGGKVLERTLSVQKGSNKAQLQLNPNLPLGMYIITTRLNGQTNHVKLMKK